MKYKTSHKVYSAWNYEKEIEDLNKASENGWQLVKGGCFHSRFVNNPDVRYRYQLDYGQVDDMGRYIETFREQGWEYVNSTFNDWHYFRKFYDPSLPEEEYEIFTDRQSIREMNGRWVRFALALGIIMVLFTLVWLVRMIRTPELPILSQLIVFIAVGAFLLRGVFIMKDPDSGRSRRGDGALLAVFFAVVLIGSASTIWMLVNRPSFNSDMRADSVTAPMTDSMINEFDVKYGDNYYIDIDYEAALPLRFAIVNDEGEVFYSVSGTEGEAKNVRVRLPKGHYGISLSVESGYSVRFSID